MESILQEIVEARRKDLESRKKEFPVGALKILAREMEKPEYDFLAALRREIPHGMHIIAEIKKASPSRGIICNDFDPRDIAVKYHEGGASAVSVLTEERFFKGCNRDLEIVAHSIPLPVLRKDFILDEYQIYESKCLGASAFLLIADCLAPARIREFISLGKELGMTALVEVHRREEAFTAMDNGAELIGINNRNLRTFKTSLQTSIDLRSAIPSGIPVVSESGIHAPEDLELLLKYGVQAVLIGEALMQNTQAIPQKMQQLLSFKG
jgi:indole-3-glycerol phosphate synthase